MSGTRTVERSRKLELASNRISGHDIFASQREHPGRIGEGRPMHVGDHSLPDETDPDLAPYEVRRYSVHLYGAHRLIAE